MLHVNTLHVQIKIFYLKISSMHYNLSGINK